MHELSYVVRFADRAVEIARENNAVSVQKLVVQVGEMTDVLPEYLQKYYPEVTKDTILAGSVLETEPLAARILCGGCGSEFHPSRENNYLCPHCGSGNGKVLEGRHVILKEVIMETGES
ncbi:MAG: hydrogenase maturation nickel metallochaperone HypA [Eubacterium sp.]|nr:hydrogenase maturation nickel metallochaperone HypA [Eubacterium sp.]